MTHFHLCFFLAAHSNYTFSQIFLDAIEGAVIEDLKIDCCTIAKMPDEKKIHTEQAPL